MLMTSGKSVHVLGCIDVVSTLLQLQLSYIIGADAVPDDCGTVLYNARIFTTTGAGRGDDPVDRWALQESGESRGPRLKC